MKETFKFANLEAKPGTKVQGLVPVEGTYVSIPVTIINGEADGPRVGITGGTHGGEYCGIETCIRLGKELTPADINGVLVMIHAANVPAFFKRVQYISPDDGKNLNGNYPGNPRGTVTERTCHLIKTQLLDQVEYYMDLHGGDLHEWLQPFANYSESVVPGVTEKAKEMTRHFGIRYVFASSSTRAGNAGGTAARQGVAAILGEIGCRGLWYEDEVTQYVRGTKNVLRHLKCLKGDVQDLGTPTYLKKTNTLRAEQTGCWYSFVLPEEKVKEGQKLGEIRDFFSNVLGEYFSPCDGEVLYTITSLPVEVGNPIVSVGEWQN